jgi:formamidopyrimidine-DNA glycosylase
MPELPEVETVRRMFERTVIGRTVRDARISGERLRDAVPRSLPRAIRRRTFAAARRHGKYLLLDLDGGSTLLSHLGMSGRWLFHEREPAERPAHVHLRVAFDDGTHLWFQDPRRFGALRVVATSRLARDPSLAQLGPDPIATPLEGGALAALGRDARVSVKAFLLDQKRIAGIGNIYASEILFRARVAPSRRAGTLGAPEWSAIAHETTAVLNEAIARMGTTFDAYRTLWGEPGGYGDRLLVYDRAGQPCRVCGSAIRRIVQGQRSTFLCPVCQGRAVRSPRVRRRRARA